MDSIIQKHALLIVAFHLVIFHRTIRKRLSLASAAWSRESLTRLTRRIVQTSRISSTKSSKFPIYKPTTAMWRTCLMWIPIPHMALPSHSHLCHPHPEQRTMQTFPWCRSCNTYLPRWSLLPSKTSLRIYQIKRLVRFVPSYPPSLMELPRFCKTRFGRESGYQTTQRKTAVSAKGAFPSLAASSVHLSHSFTHSHCRWCGLIFCNDCSRHRVSWAFLGKNQRLCDNCYCMYSNLPISLHELFCLHWSSFYLQSVGFSPCNSILELATCFFHHIHPQQTVKLYYSSSASSTSSTPLRA